MHLSYLEILSIGHYYVERDGQLDWILGHGETLRSMYLHDCAIINEIMVRGYEESFDADGYVNNPSNDINGELDEVIISERYYQQRWADCLSKIANCMDHLEQFQMQNDQTRTFRGFTSDGLGDIYSYRDTIALLGAACYALLCVNAEAGEYGNY